MPHRLDAKHPPWTRYLGAWLGLLGLTLLSFGFSYVHTGAWEIPIALLIAVVKSVLVLLVFMHLLEDRFTNAFVIVVALALLGLLLTLVAADVTARRTFPPTPLGESPPPPPQLGLPPGGSAGPPPEPLPGRL